MTTFLILLLFAIIFLVAGGALLYFRIRTEQKAAMMGQTETSGASDVSGLAPGALADRIDGIEHPENGWLPGSVNDYLIFEALRPVL